MSRANTSATSPRATSPGPGKIRSESSPAKMTSPEKQSPPVLQSVEKKVPRLDLSAPVMDEVAVIRDACEPVLKSPASASAVSPRVRFAAGSSLVCSTSAPVTPRAKSSRPTEEARSPRRHWIDQSPRKTSDGRRQASDIGPYVTSSPRKANDDLMTLGAEAAKLICSEMRAKSPKLTKATIIQLARFETQIAMDKLSTELRARITEDGSRTISHAKLIKALFLPLLRSTEVGKALNALRMTVMGAYDGNTLTLVDVEMREAEEPGYKKRLLDNLEPQARGCAALIIGLDAPALSASKLPRELIAFWKAMDAELCDWASQNPDLPPSELKSARANLGFDLLLTRLVLPLASGPKEEAALAIPALFFKSVKNALLADWPKFVDSFIHVVELERSAASLAISTSSTSWTASTTAALMTTAAPVHPEPRLEDGVFQQ